MKLPQIDADGMSDHRFQSGPLFDKFLTYISQFKPLLVWRIAHSKKNNKIGSFSFTSLSIAPLSQNGWATTVDDLLYGMYHSLIVVASNSYHGVIHKAWFPINQLRPRQRPISTRNKVIKPGFHYTANATTTTQRQSDYKVEQSSFTLIALF